MNDSQLYVNAKDTEGKTLLHHAAANNARQEAALLLRHNADVSARDENGYPPCTKLRQTIQVKRQGY